MTDLEAPEHRHGPPPVPAHLPGDARELEGRGHPLRLALLGALVLAAGFGGGWPLLVMIAALVVMIFLHELGHYLTAKWAGMKVTEFFIGFGPRIWSTHRGETEYGIKAIPAGAYVKIIGMHNLDEFDPADAERTYMSKPFWRRFSVAVAGSTMHFLLAIVCFFGAFGIVGLPGGIWPTSESDLDALEAQVGWTVQSVVEGGGAAAAGVEPGDRIVAIDGAEVLSFDAFGEIVRGNANETVTATIERDGRSLDLEVTIGERDGEGLFGVGHRFSIDDLRQIPEQRYGVLDAVGETGAAVRQSFGETFTGLAHILSPTGLSDLGRAAFTTAEDGLVIDDTSGSGGSTSQSSSSSSSEPQAAGVIGISGLGAGLLDDGQFGYFLAVFATINVFIGVFNLLPLLPLDGGHVVIAIYEKVRSMLQGGREYHIDVVKLLPVTYAVVLVLAFLGVSTIVLDTRSLVGG